ncbi:cation-transporting P-type ATPase, partial [Actinoplanes xinjiangensis]
MTVRNLQVAPDPSDSTRPSASHGVMHVVAPEVGGLSSGDAAQRLARDGGNVLPVRRPPPLWR